VPHVRRSLRFLRSSSPSSEALAATASGMGEPASPSIRCSARVIQSLTSADATVG